MILHSPQFSLGAADRQLLQIASHAHHLRSGDCDAIYVRQSLLHESPVVEVTPGCRRSFPPFHCERRKSQRLREGDRMSVLFGGGRSKTYLAMATQRLPAAPRCFEGQQTHSSVF